MVPTCTPATTTPPTARCCAPCSTRDDVLDLQTGGDDLEDVMAAVYRRRAGVAP
ncbi:MAG: hypothetical protein PGN11_06090 [Quadrisphaera sp.]